MGEWDNQRSWEGEREGEPAGRRMPAGGTLAVPPPFLVYKRRLYVLARKPPVLDHRQADIDSIFGTEETPRPKPVHQVHPGPRTAIHQPAMRRAFNYGKSHASSGEKGRSRVRPRFVPRNG